MPECTVRPPLRFQVLCLPNVPWDDLQQRFIRLEQLGIEVAALPDHFVDWTDPPSPWFESWTALTGLAAATTSIRLTTWVPTGRMRWGCNMEGEHNVGPAPRRAP